MGAIAGAETRDVDDLPRTSSPSQNFGNSFPGMKSRSTPSSVITHMRMTPPEEPSRDIARARAVEELYEG